jgi:hypothetical protein
MTQFPNSHAKPTSVCSAEVPKSMLELLALKEDTSKLLQSLPVIKKRLRVRA